MVKMTCAEPEKGLKFLSLPLELPGWVVVGASFFEASVL
jgi:hypothetical protein